MGRLERQKLKKETPSIEQTVILNLTDFMHMSHPVRFSSSSAFKYYVILLPLRVQEPVWKWKGFLFEISLYNKEGRKIQCSDLRYPLMVILKKKSISLSSLITWGSPIQLQKTVPDSSKLQKKLTSLGEAWQWVKSYYYLARVWVYTLYTNAQPLAKLLAWGT